jgi:hypothetical protein
VRAWSRRELGFSLVFGLCLAWGAWNYRHLFTPRGPAETPSLSGPAASTAAASERSGTAEGTERTESMWGSDPFNRTWRSPRATLANAGVVVKKAALRLSAIVVRPPKRYAIINGQIVQEGETVAGRRVTRIETSRVLVDDNGVEVTLTL